MNRKFNIMRGNYLLLLIVAILMTACAGQHDVAYFSDATRDVASPIDNVRHSVVQKGDVIHIYVSSQDAESVIPLNQETNRMVEGVSVPSVNINDEAYDPMVMQNLQIDRVSTPNLGYTVDQRGRILFPSLGSLTVEGLTLDSLNHMLEHMLKDRQLVKDPIVTTRLLNFHITVLGEVTQPGWVRADNSRITLLEALAKTGDMTIFGQRNNVKVIREVDGVLTVGVVDMTSKQLFDSPYYYLQQNDVVFVEPNKKKKREYGRNDYIMQYIHLGISIGSLTTQTAATIVTAMQYSK